MIIFIFLFESSKLLQIKFITLSLRRKAYKTFKSSHDRLKELRIINLIDIESNKCYWSFIKLSDIFYFPNPPKVISEIPCTNWQLNTLEEG